MINKIADMFLLLLMMSLTQASVPAARESFSRIGFSNVMLLRGLSTHKAKSIAVSQRIASILGLVKEGAVLPSPSVEFLFQPDLVKLQIRPELPPGVPGFVVDLNIKSITVIADLLKDEIIISNKIRMPQLSQKNVKWICITEVKQRPGLQQDFFGALRLAAEYNLSDSEERYYYVRRHIKRWFQDFRNGLVSIDGIELELDSLKFSRMLRQLTNTGLEDLWEESLKYNKRYCLSSIRLKWALYTNIGKKVNKSPIIIFSPIDIIAIAASILRDKLASDMIELLKESEIINSLAQTQKTSLTRAIRSKNYMNSSELALMTINLFRNSYNLEWIKSDIFALIIISSESKTPWIDTSAVREFLNVMTEDYHGYLSRTWLKTFIQTVNLYKIQQVFEEWQGCGLFGIYLWVLYNHVPQFFMQVEWTTFKDQKKNQLNPFADLKDAVLEMTSLVSCLTLKRIANSPRLPPKEIPYVIQSTMSRFHAIESSFVAKEGFKNMMMAIDYWLQVTGFCDALVLLNQEPDKRPTEVGRVAKILGREIMRSFRHLVSLQKKFNYDPTLVLLFLSKLKLSRVVLVLVWSKSISLPQDGKFLADFANNDIFGTAYAVWASLLIDPTNLALTLSSGSLAMLEGGNDSEAFFRTISSLGGKVDDPCGEGGAQEVIIWKLPDILNSGKLVLESSVALLRSYLLFKFGVPFGISRSSTAIAGGDHIQPFEYAQFMNFWLERHCALKCHSSKKLACRPKYKIVIDGV